jgi:hypothetical protein
MMTEDGAFSITPTYLRLAAQEEKILGFRAVAGSWASGECGAGGADAEVG